MRAVGRWRPLSAALLLAVACACSVLPGCTSVRNDLGTSSGDCYVAIPAATDAVGGHGHLVGVRLVGVGALPSYSRRLYSAARSAPGRRVTRVCLVAFAGRFDASSVTAPIGRSTGRVAVVEVTYPENRVLGTLLVGRSEVPFGHSHIGLP